MPPRSKSKKEKEAANPYFNKKNAPIIGSVVLLVFGVLLAIMPTTRVSPLAKAGFQQAERGHPPQLQQAVDAIHAARDKPDFTAEVMLSIVHRFYRVLLGGPTDSVNATTEWSKLSGGVFRVYGFAVDDSSPSAMKGGDPNAFKKAVANQVMREAHIHMIARDGDSIFLDADSQFGAEYLTERCAAYSAYGLKCRAWDDAAIADHINSVVADHQAATTANEGLLAAPGTPARPQLFLVGKSARLNTVGMWPDDSDRTPHPVQPLHGVPHLILLPASEEHLREQQLMAERYQQRQQQRAQEAAAAQFATTKPAADDKDDDDDDDDKEEEISNK